MIASRLIERHGDRVRVYLKLRRESALVTVHYNTEHEVEHRRSTRPTPSSRSTATKIAEIADAGKPSEREKKPGETTTAFSGG